MLHFHKPNKKEKRLLNGNFTFKKPKVSNDNHNEEQRTFSATRKAIEKNHKQNKTLEILTIPYYYYFHTPGNFLIKRFKICSSTLRNWVFLLWGEGVVENHESLIRNRKNFVIQNKTIEPKKIQTSIFRIFEMCYLNLNQVLMNNFSCEGLFLNKFQTKQKNIPTNKRRLIKLINSNVNFEKKNKSRCPKRPTRSSFIVYTKFIAILG